HSDKYLQCAKVLQWPERAGALGAALGEKLAGLGIDAVVSPAMGGLIIGHEIGRALGRRAVFAERVDGAFTLRRGFGLEAGEKVVVVEDVVTTGGSTREVLALVKSLGAVAVACAAVVDRRGASPAGGAETLEGLPFRSVLRMEVPTWEEAACPYCRLGQEVVSPGSRRLSSAKA
ncbi:MAG TPA: orotate phosphoribosyltransferase, partial [Thermoanaerobaculia bacterium]|nr:orotate phosphoribosyltransferase [Thermoanaerobaculia bacterium]